jgi:hypothetical protein
MYSLDPFVDITYCIFSLLLNIRILKLNWYGIKKRGLNAPFLNKNRDIDINPITGLPFNYPLIVAPVNTAPNTCAGVAVCSSSPTLNTVFAGVFS